MSHEITGTAKTIVMIGEKLGIMSLVSFHASNDLCRDSPNPYDTDCINDPHTRIENNTIVRAAMSHPSQALCPKPSKEVKVVRLFRRVRG